MTVKRDCKSGEIAVPRPCLIKEKVGPGATAEFDEGPEGGLGGEEVDARGVGREDVERESALEEKFRFESSAEIAALGCVVGEIAIGAFFERI